MIILVFVSYIISFVCGGLGVVSWVVCRGDD